MEGEGLRQAERAAPLPPRTSAVGQDEQSRGRTATVPTATSLSGTSQVVLLEIPINVAKGTAECENGMWLQAGVSLLGTCCQYSICCPIS